MLKKPGLTVLMLILVSLLVSCDFLIGDDDDDKDIEDKDDDISIVGTWVSYSGNTFKLNADYTYEYTGMWAGEVSYGDRGTYTATAEMLSFTTEDVWYEGGWVAGDFNSEIQRDLVEWNTTFSTDLNLDDYWGVMYTYASDDNPDTDGYEGYEDGMSLEEYKVAAEAAYTASLTYTADYTVESTQTGVTLTVDLPDYGLTFFERQ